MLIIGTYRQATNICNIYFSRSSFKHPLFTLFLMVILSMSQLHIVIWDFCFRVMQSGHLVQIKNLLKMLKHLLYRNSLIKNVFALLYFALIRPILEYGGAVWDNCSLENSNLFRKYTGRSSKDTCNNWSSEKFF